MIQLMFETFKGQRFYITITAILSLYSYGRTTGLVFDSGDVLTSTFHVCEGFRIPDAVCKNFIAGRAVTDHMIKLLAANGVA